MKNEAIEIDNHEQFLAAARGLRKHIKHERTKLDKQRIELVAAASWVHDRQIADSILSSLSNIRKGEVETILPNLHSGENEIIKLNPKLSPRENADLYYKKARRGERGEEECREKVAASERLLEKFEEIEAEFEAAKALDRDSAEFAAALEKLLQNDLFRVPQGQPLAANKTDHSRKPEPSVPYRHFTIDGHDIWVGRTDEQNDELTTRFAKPWHIWLHVASHAGSHVVIARQKNTPWPPDKIVETAAAFSVWFSKAKHTSYSEVHVTEARFVCKRRGSPAGQVQISQYKTLRVSPISPQVFFKDRTIEA